MAEPAQFRCPKDIEEGRSSRGPVSRFRLKLRSGIRASVCRDCFIDDARESLKANGEILRRVHGIAEDETKVEIGKIAALFQSEVADVWAGKVAGMNGKGSPVRASDRASDLVALARLILARPILSKAQGAYTQLTTSDVKLSQEMEQTVAVLGNNLAAAKEELDSAWSMVGTGETVDPTKPLKLRFGERRALWGKCRRALEGVQGMATTFGKLAAGDEGAEERAKKRLEDVFGGRENLRRFFQSDLTSDRESAEGHTRESLEAITKDELSELAIKEFSLQLPYSTKKDDMIAKILKAQEGAEEPAVA